MEKLNTFAVHLKNTGTMYQPYRIISTRRDSKTTGQLWNEHAHTYWRTNTYTLTHMQWVIHVNTEPAKSSLNHNSVLSRSTSLRSMSSSTGNCTQQHTHAMSVLIVNSWRNENNEWLGTMRSQPNVVPTSLSLPSHGVTVATRGSADPWRVAVEPRPTESSRRNSLMPVSLKGPLISEYFILREFRAAIAYTTRFTNNSYLQTATFIHYCAVSWFCRKLSS